MRSKTAKVWHGDALKDTDGLMSTIQGILKKMPIDRFSFQRPIARDLIKVLEVVTWRESVELSKVKLRVFFVDALRDFSLQNNNVKVAKYYVKTTI